jgi:hypothetical protein
MHKILPNFHASASGRFGRLGSSHFLSENFLTSVIKLGLKMLIVPNLNRPSIPACSRCMWPTILIQFIQHTYYHNHKLAPKPICTQTNPHPSQPNLDPGNLPKNTQPTPHPCSTSSPKTSKEPHEKKKMPNK